MIKKTGQNGIFRAAEDNRAAEQERISAKVDYIAMMCDVDIPTEEDANNEQEV